MGKTLVHMNTFTTSELKHLNAQLKGISPAEIISWALQQADKAVVTTNFRPYEVAILHAVSLESPAIPVLWCDTGYNTKQTYVHAEKVTELLQLNIQLYVPKQTVAHRDVTLGVPDINDPNHALFTSQVKLEPFKRAMAEHQPSIWFTNLRKGQTAHRDSLDILSLSGDGILKVSPFYHWSDTQLDAYLTENQLPNEHVYFDPTKVEANRECGLHV